MGRCSSGRPAVCAAAAAAVLPLVVAAVTLSRRRWFPALDVTLIHLRVRDVFSTHPPVLSIPGRFGDQLADPGSHPGPLAFYLLAPVHRLFGASPWALQVACLALHVAAVGVAVWIGWRTARRAGAVAVAVAAALTVWSFGPLVLTQPWNPYQPITAWLLVVVAVWAVAAGDDRMLLVAVFSGSLAAQMHISYLPGVAVLVAIAAVLAVVRSPRRAIAAGLLGAVLWVPTAVEQATNDPGNLTKIWAELGSSDAVRLGWWDATRAAVARFDAIALFGGNIARVPVLAQSEWRGLVVCVVWLGVAGSSWSRAPFALRRLHVTLAVAGVVGIVAIARVNLPLWPYLTLWSAVTTALVVAAVAWSGAVAASGLVAAHRGSHRRWRHAGLVAIAAGIVAVSSAATVSYAKAPLPEPVYNELSAGLAGPLRDAVGGDGTDGAAGPYVITIYDVMDLGSVAFALLADLERHGVDVALEPHFETLVGAHRVRPRDSVETQIVVATGGWVDRWRATAGAIELAAADTRTAQQRTSYAAARSDAIAALRDAGRDDLVEQVDSALFGLLLNADVPPAAAEPLGVMAGLGQHAAVFVAPADLRPA